MTNNKIVESSFNAIINAPIESVDIADWVFNLTEAEYRSCSPAHVAAGFTRAQDGRRMSINVEVIGGNPMVQHYVEDMAQKHHVILKSVSDVFAPAGRTSIHVTWEMSVAPIDKGRCEFTNRVVTHTTDEFERFLERQGIPFEQFQAQREPASVAHNRSETPLFAASLERAALRR